MNFRVNAGLIPKDNWIQKPEIGGGRIIGEMCHFFDLMQFLTDSSPVKVYAESIQATNDKYVNQDNVLISVKFKNGSIGNLTYVSNGNASMPKEKLEVFCGGMACVIQDFKKVHYFEKGKEVKSECNGKGHREEVIEFLNAVKIGKPDPISFESIVATTRLSFAK